MGNLLRLLKVHVFEEIVGEDIGSSEQNHDRDDGNGRQPATNRVAEYAGDVSSESLHR